MKKVVLKNGLTILYERKPVKSVTVQVMVKMGSDHEQEEERGIAHFLEHMLFEGTKKRPTSWDVANAIERVGGDFNAYTTNERTCYYVRVVKKHFRLAIDVLSDIMQNPLFDPVFLEKEKQIVLKEIDMIFDEPRYYQWMLFQKNLFSEHPARLPTFGRREVIAGLTKEQIEAYFAKYYVPNNMVISIVGDVKDWKRMVERYFVGEPGMRIVHPKVSEPAAIKDTVVKEKRPILNTYLVLGFKSVPRTHKDAAVLEVINAILGRGQSGKMFTQIRSKRGLAYDVGSEHVAEGTFGYFAVYATIDRKNVKKVTSLILDELAALAYASEEEVNEAKMFVEGDYVLELEHTHRLADQLCYWEQLGDISLMKKFLPAIKAVSVRDVRRVAKKYFKNYTQAILEGTNASR